MIKGTRVTLRPARESDRRAVYEWLACSDVTASMMGPPLFPEVVPPTWGEFCEDYDLAFFDGSKAVIERSFVIEVDGTAVGHVNYQMNSSAPGVAELDIWLRSEAECGHGYGSAALVALVGHLNEALSVTEFIIRPSRRNARAVAAYERAGFEVLPLTQDEQTTRFGPGDYEDTVAMRRLLPPVR